jgi:hypothetical protein
LAHKVLSRRGDLNPRASLVRIKRISDKTTKRVGTGKSYSSLFEMEFYQSGADYKLPVNRNIQQKQTPCSCSSMSFFQPQLTMFSTKLPVLAFTYISQGRKNFL